MNNNCFSVAIVLRETCSTVGKKGRNYMGLFGLNSNKKRIAELEKENKKKSE